MSNICYITKKKPIRGNKISKSKNKNKRWFKINIIKKKIFDIKKNKWIKFKMSTSALRLIKKNGLIKLITKKYEKK
ncbi:MAG: 50S ribosomal protein L28 [Candidatus Shikimatogenerans sp. JK-2022]|nr:50S ribosomal protein L28 [Candidatus Shikimatogenerans bostrichidophilus]